MLKRTLIATLGLISLPSFGGRQQGHIILLAKVVAD